MTIISQRKLCALKETNGLEMQQIVFRDSAGPGYVLKGPPNQTL